MNCMREKFASGVLLNGRYQTISPLNHGSFGMVFTGRDIVTDQTVAIKCMAKSNATAAACPDFAVDEKSEELALHTRLASHPNIVNLLDSFETEAHMYLVLEFCAQGDLYEAIRHGHGPLETEHVRQFMLELVDAVAYIHSKEVYHRDIKPENVFISQDGTMKLGDFGLATTDKWSYEMTVGSDRYMAPEQFDSAGAGYSPAGADIWAIGICLLNVLFSRNPFTTPTESDPLFLDYSRDKQSLFDVFPSMSLDTYEVISQCMSLDPRKRSLEAAREALLRVVSFTTQDEALDDFCGADTTTIASANREPLRTPSIQTPMVDTGAFPWAKALNATPRKNERQLSVIMDNESYTEELFPKSEDTGDWCSAAAQTPSMSSMLGSTLGASMKSMAIPAGRAKASPVAGSLPINVAKPMTLSMSTVFGRRKDAMSKSWSDMWEEDEEEEEELAQQLQKLKDLNSRTWSHESKGELDLKKADKVTAVPAAHDIKGNVDDDLVADGFFFHEPSISKAAITATPRYSPPPKRNHNVDKWAALGDRRRQNATEMTPEVKRRHFAFGYNSKTYEAGVLDHSNSPFQQTYNKHQHSGKDRSVKGASPWLRARDLDWRRGARTELGDIEWVGGW